MGKHLDLRASLKDLKRSTSSRYQDVDSNDKDGAVGSRKTSRKQAIQAFFRHRPLKLQVEETKSDSSSPPPRKAKSKSHLPLFPNHSTFSHEHHSDHRFDLLDVPSLCRRPSSFIKPKSPNAHEDVPQYAGAEPALLRAWGSKSDVASPNEPTFKKDSVTGRRMSSLSPMFAMSVPAVSSPLSSVSSHEPKVLGAGALLAMVVGSPEFMVDRSTSTPVVNVRMRAEVDAQYEEPSDCASWAHESFALSSMSSAESQVTDTALQAVRSMKGSKGLDIGTVGLEYLCQRAVTDGTSAAAEHDTLAKRKGLLAEPEKLGFRPLDLHCLVRRLSELGDLYHAREEQAACEKRAAEMYTELFTSMLPIPRFVTETEGDPTGLDVQIAALVTALDLSDLWLDFSSVDNRLRLGQILLSQRSELDILQEESEEAESEYNVLLLQVVLASELLIRMRLSQGKANLGPLSQKVQWDLILAQRFLENVHVSEKTQASGDSPNRNSIFSAASFFTAREAPEDGGVWRDVELELAPQHEQRQVDGLLAFAEGIAWPHKQEIEQRVRHKQQERAKRLTVPSTPVMSHRISRPGQESYFTQLPRPQLVRRATPECLQLTPPSTVVDEQSNDNRGWLTRSWLLGLVLPGEAACYLLMATMLENSPPQTVEALGDTMYPHGGFVYRGRSYWSKRSAVGRVLAAANGAKECMGWISAPGVPTGSTKPNCWIDVQSQEASWPSATSLPSTEDLLAKASSFVPETATANATDPLTEADFVWPTDSPPILGNEGVYTGMSISPYSDSTTSPSDTPSPNAPSQAPSSMSMSLTFRTKPSPFSCSTTTSKPKQITLPLRHSIHFISAHPCHPTQSAPPQRPPRIVVAGEEGAEKELPAPPCHPLHVQHARTMRIEPAASLLYLPAGNDDGGQGVETSASASASAPAVSSTSAAAVPPEQEILVLDCRGCEDLHILARAWCAKVGEHALVGRVGRTCLACCVREARGLGVGVVIRL